jgi:hypothetical protein
MTKGDALDRKEMMTMPAVACAQPAPPPAAVEAEFERVRAAPGQAAVVTDATDAAPGPPATGALPAEVLADPDARALVREYPAGRRLRFRGYHPAIWPRDWRRAAEREPWGLRPGDLVEVTGYGVTRGFPEALLVRRLADGVEAMIFPPEVAPEGAFADGEPAPQAVAA